MTEIVVGERVGNKVGETGIITAFDGQYITVAFQSRAAMFRADAFEKGHIKYEKNRFGIVPVCCQIGKAVVL